MTSSTLTKTSPMEELAVKLVTQIQALNQYLGKEGQKLPSFDRDTPPVVVPHDAPESVHAVRDSIMDYALQILQLATGPSDFLAHLQPGYHYIAALQWLCAFDILNIVPLEGDVSYAEVAQKAGVSEARLKSVARMAMTSRLFVEPAEERMAHSATSALLRENKSFADWAVFMTNISAPTAAGMVEAHRKWPADTLKNHTAYNVAFDTDLPFFQYLKQSPVLEKQFSGYMRSVANDRGTHLSHLTHAFDWKKLGKALVVDVGGSTGHGSAELAKSFPDLSFIVQDLPAVAADGKEHIASLGDSGLTSRIQFQGHSFFDPQPVTHGDVYLLRMILHDWPFDDSVRILAHLVAAMKTGARIMVMDTVLPRPGSIPAVKERLLRVRDLTMMQVFNSLERSMEDWEAIFRKVDPRLVVKSVSHPPGSSLSLIELELSV